MSRPTIRIDVEDARELSALVAEEWPQNGANARLLAALARHDLYASKPRRKPATGYERRPILDSLRPAHPKPSRKAEKRATKAERRDETATIWQACWKRCDFKCECGCGRDVFQAGTLGVDLNSKAELEHPFSKGKGARLPQSVETCWILRADCHRERTANRPDAATWWKKFIAHLTRVGQHGPAYWRAWNAAVGRLRFVEVRRSLPAAPRLDSIPRTE
jgi:hypothetical protein